MWPWMGKQCILSSSRVKQASAYWPAASGEDEFFPAVGANDRAFALAANLPDCSACYCHDVVVSRVCTTLHLVFLSCPNHISACVLFRGVEVLLLSIVSRHLVGELTVVSSELGRQRMAPARAAMWPSRAPSRGLPRALSGLHAAGALAVAVVSAAMAAAAVAAAVAAAGAAVWCPRQTWTRTWMPTWKSEVAALQAILY